MKKMLAALLLAFAPALLAQERRPGQPSGAPAPGSKETEAPEKTERAAAKETPRDQISTTQHSVTIDGQTINYTARAGTIVMKDEEGTPKASFFFVSYTRDGADPARRASRAGPTHGPVAGGSAGRSRAPGSLRHTALRSARVRAGRTERRSRAPGGE